MTVAAARSRIQPDRPPITAAVAGPTGLDTVDVDADRRQMATRAARGSPGSRSARSIPKDPACPHTGVVGVEARVVHRDRLIGDPLGGGTCA